MQEVGVVLLAAVLVLAQTSYGAKLSLMGIQPSEVIKLTFVFFYGFPSGKRSYLKKVVLCHDRGGTSRRNPGIVQGPWKCSGVFVAYLVLIYVSTKKPVYLGIGIAGGRSRFCYRLSFVWPCEGTSERMEGSYGSIYQNEGYQIVQSLFAIGTGGWLEMGSAIIRN